MKIQSCFAARRMVMVLMQLGALAVLACRPVLGAAPTMDTITFGNDASEQAHSLTAEGSTVVQGGLGLPARKLNGPGAAVWQGGRVAFTLKVDPAEANYVTVRLWGSEATPNRLVLFCQGKQIGYYHLGDYDLLDYGSEQPPYTGRFFYNTSPLPLEMTRGKSQIDLEIRATGGINGFGNGFAGFQRSMSGESKSIYSAYSHTDPCFVPAGDEKQGAAPRDPPVRTTPGLEVLDALKKRVDREINKILSDARAPGQLEMQLLGRAYHIRWTAAFQNESAVKKIIQGADALYTAFRENPKIAQEGPGVYNPEWLGLGPAADGVRLIGASLQSRLSEKIAGDVARSQGWSAMFQASRDWHRRHRRLYTNQSMITDLNTYRANRAVAAVDPSNAMSEQDAVRYLYESIGIQPWRDSDPEANSTSQPRGSGVGDNYYQITRRGLTRELGYVGYYGEVLDWVTHIYNATVDPTDPASGDRKIRTQLAKMEHARAAFRYPMLDGQGNRAMRLEAVVGWRDNHYPGDVTYAERSAWEGSAIYAAAATLDSASVGYAQQMFADNQFFASVEQLVKDQGIRVTLSLVLIPDQYDLLRAQSPSARRLPMTPGQPDFVFTDEEDGVVALKRGEEMLYASLYWRARTGVNFLARVHCITPEFDRLATARQQTQFDDSGQTSPRPDWIAMGFGNGGPKYPGVESAHSGEKMPIAKGPHGETNRPGRESVTAGKGTFYTLRYGDYLIGMNCTSDRSFPLDWPGNGAASAMDLTTGKRVTASQPMVVKPQSTMVLYLAP